MRSLALIAAASAELPSAFSEFPAAARERMLAGHRSKPRVIEAWRDRAAAKECEHPRLGMDQDWEEMDPYQHLAWGMLGWNETMWDLWDEKLDQRLFLWTDAPTTTTTSTTSSTEEDMWPTPPPTPPVAEDNATTTPDPTARRLRGRQLDAHLLQETNSSNATNVSANETVGGAQVIPSVETTTTTTTTTEGGRQIPAKCYFDLNRDAQMAVLALGYTVNSWNCFQPCPTYDLGGDDGNSDLTPCMLVFNELELFHDRDYEHLSVNEKAALTVLGIHEEHYTASRALDGVAMKEWPRPKMFKWPWFLTEQQQLDYEPARQWDEMTHEEQDAAGTLGYSLSTWNGCSGRPEEAILEEHFPTTPSPPPPPELDLNRVVQAVLVLMKQEFSEVSGMQSVFRKSLQMEFAHAVQINPSRVVVIDVRKGDEYLYDGQSVIVVDLIFRQPAVENQPTAVAAFSDLKDKLSDPVSDIRRNQHLAEYLVETSFYEIEMEEGYLDRMKAYQDFEELRAMYNDSTACQLKEDPKNGILPCKKAGVGLISFAAIFLFLMA